MSERYCTVCKQPAKGHVGPMGTNCKNETDIELLGATAAEENVSKFVKDSRDGEINTNIIMRNLLEQMTQMNTNLERLAIGQDRLLSQLNHPSNTVGSPNVAISPNISTSPNVSPVDPSHPPRANIANISLASTSRPDKHVSQAENGEFVNLSDFLPGVDYISGEMEPVFENGSFIFRPKRTKTRIDNFATWSKAWNGYERVIMAKHPNTYSKLVDYREMIQNSNAKYQWHAVSNYDIRFRTELAKTRSFNFDVLDTTLFTTILDATAVKFSAKTCLRCKSYDHFVSNCPFPSDSAITTSPSDIKSQRSNNKRGSQVQPWYHNGNEGCNNFQTGNCNFTSCKRAHVCRECKGPEPMFKCKSCA